MRSRHPIAAVLACVLAAPLMACGVPLDVEPDPVEEVPVDEEPQPEPDTPPAGDTPVEEPPVEEPRTADVDGDSLADPAQSVFLSITGNRQLGHTDAISFPDGDAADFVEFELPNASNPAQNVFVTLDCALEGDAGAAVHATLFENGESTTTRVTCNDGEQIVTVDNTAVQTFRIAVTTASEPVFVDYTLTVVGFR